MTKYLKILLFLSLILLLVAGCYRGKPSERPPIHLNPDMDNQPRYDPQSESHFFADDATMRTPVSGTIARGSLEDEIFHAGRLKNGDFAKDSPVLITLQSLKRGQERYNIYCSVCHGRAGDGQGIMLSRGYIPPPSFHIARIKKMPDGEIFNTITNGIRNMPAYRYQIPASDRWAIINYLRALQRSQNATANDIPIELRDKIK